MKSESKKPRPFLIIELLNTFSKRELSDFSDFAACRYFNTDRYVTALLAVLIEEVIRKKEFDKEMQSLVYRLVFPEKPKPGKVLTVQQKNFILVKMNLLMGLAKHFLCHEALKENAACRTELLYEKLLERNQFWLFNREMKKDKKTLEAQSAKGVDEYAQQFKMGLEQLNYLHRRGLILKEDNLPEVIEHLDIYYLLYKLNLHTACLALNRVRAGKAYDYAPMEAVQALMDLPQYQAHPLIRLHRMAIDLSENNDVDTYHQFLSLLDEYSDVVPMKDLNNFYKVAVNVCSAKIKDGLTAFYDYAFELYQTMDRKNLLIEGNFMPAVKLKNMVTLCCRLNEFEWAKKIIEKYQSVLEKKYAKSVYHYNMGVIAFYQRDFKAALSHFIRVEKVNIAYDIDCRLLLLKSHYELDVEYDERTMRTFLMAERFVNKNKSLVSKDKKAYKNFVRILINIYNTRHGAGKMTAEKVKKKLEKLEFVGDKKWLLEKVEGLLSR